MASVRRRDGRVARSAASPVTEDVLHFALVQWLSWQRMAGPWWHTPNTASSIPYAVKLKKMGRRKGVLDLQFIRYPNFTGFIELKLHPNNLSDDQEIFCAALRAAQVPYVVIRTKTPEATIEQAKAFLKEHGFLVS